MALTCIPYSGYFSGGEIFVSSEFLASSWKNSCGRGILNHTRYYFVDKKFRGSPLNHENHENFTHPLYGISIFANFETKFLKLRPPKDNASV